MIDIRNYIEHTDIKILAMEVKNPLLLAEIKNYIELPSVPPQHLIKCFAVLPHTEEEARNITALFKASIAREDLFKMCITKASQTGNLDTLKIGLNGFLPADLIGKIENPLIEACQGDHFEVVQALIDYGFPVNKKNVYGDTLLHLRISAKMIDLLVNNGGDVHARNNLGRAPIHRPTNKEAALALLANGADESVKDKEGRNPLHFAFKLRNEELVNFFTEFKDLCIDYDEFFYFPCQYGGADFANPFEAALPAVFHEIFRVSPMMQKGESIDPILNEWLGLPDELFDELMPIVITNPKLRSRLLELGAARVKNYRLTSLTKKFYFQKPQEQKKILSEFSDFTNYIALNSLVRSSRDEFKSPVQLISLIASGKEEALDNLHQISPLAIALLAGHYESRDTMTNVMDKMSREQLMAFIPKLTPGEWIYKHSLIGPDLKMTIYPYSTPDQLRELTEKDIYEDKIEQIESKMNAADQIFNCTSRLTELKIHVAAFADSFENPGLAEQKEVIAPLVASINAKINELESELKERKA